MTKSEFNTWKNAYFTAFPDTQAWIAKQPDKGVGTLATWFRCLEKCEYADLALVTDKVICGELTQPGMVGSPGFQKMEREQTAIHLRAYAGRLADDRHRVQKQMAERRRISDGKAQARKIDGPGAASMFTQILKFREEAVARGLSDDKPTPNQPSEVSVYASEKLEAWLAENSDRVAVDPGDAYEP